MKYGGLRISCPFEDAEGQEEAEGTLGAVVAFSFQERSKIIADGMPKRYPLHLASVVSLYCRYIIVNYSLVLQQI